MLLQTLLSAEEMVDAEAVPVEFPEGPKSAVAFTSGLAQEARAVSVSREVRNEEQVEEMPLGMSGLAWEIKSQYINFKLSADLNREGGCTMHRAIQPK